MVMVIRIGIIGKTNAGKTTLFNSMTLQTAEISNYPFTTKSPNAGMAQAVTLCVHKEFGVQDNPKNSRCEEGWRFIPIEVTDLPGLIKGAWMGKGLGNQFLSVAAQSDALLHVVDASGSVDKDGRVTETGHWATRIADFADVELELVLWYTKLFSSNMGKIAKLSKLPGADVPRAVAEVMQGIGVRKEHVHFALKESPPRGEGHRELDREGDPELLLDTAGRLEADPDNSEQDGPAERCGELQEAEGALQGPDRGPHERGGRALPEKGGAKGLHQVRARRGEVRRAEAAGA